MTSQIPDVPQPNRNDHPSISPWLDEQIWGHRLWDQQSPWLTFLEFLCVAEACERQGQLLNEQGNYYPLVFHPYKRMYLRNILFNNTELTRLAMQGRDNDASWNEWISWMNENGQGVPIRDFSYLRGRFHSFGDFAMLVGMLRESAVESERGRRWTSRFVFPYGAQALYVDVNIGPTGKPVPEYINFGRTGEILYLMLCRSKHCAYLVGPLQRIIGATNNWNTLLGLLQPLSADDDTFERGHSYLPYTSHRTFDQLGEDWAHIFKLQLPGFDPIPYLVLLGAFHLLLYQLEVASGWIGRSQPPYMICEVVAPKKTPVRELSITNYQENAALSEQAVAAYICAIEQSEEWQLALRNSGAFAACVAILQKKVWWPSKPDDYEGPADPTSLLAELRSESARGHRQHAAQVHHTYGRDAGLVSRRGTTKLRYAPDDRFLKALIVANVETHMELSEFLTCLYDRYGLVFGEHEAERALVKDEFDKKAFQANAQRLEQRLGSLGMLKRLSDSCAYVENPYRRRVPR